MQLKEEITEKFSAETGLKHRFVAIDLAPNEALETGFSVIDRERNLIRIDKFYKDDEIFNAVMTVGPPNGTVVVIDMPKNLAVSSRWRSEEIKMHPLRLTRPNGETHSRYEKRGLRLYDRLQAAGILVFIYFNYWTRVNYQMQVPFRSRSPQGCRALQTLIEHQLDIHHLPNNLAASSVLESMVGAYAGWSVWAGTPHEDYQIFHDDTQHQVLVPMGRPHLKQKPPRTRRFGRRVPHWMEAIRAQRGGKPRSNG